MQICLTLFYLCQIHIRILLRKQNTQIHWNQSDEIVTKYCQTFNLYRLNQITFRYTKFSFQRQNLRSHMELIRLNNKVRPIVLQMIICK